MTVLPIGLTPAPAPYPPPGGAPNGAGGVPYAAGGAAGVGAYAGGGADGGRGGVGAIPPPPPVCIGWATPTTVPLNRLDGTGGVALPPGEPAAGRTGAGPGSGGGWFIIMVPLNLGAAAPFSWKLHFEQA